jgi:3-methyladenine DNA glycosylase/8-oxoguanine DNA glycosylase
MAMAYQLVSWLEKTSGIHARKKSDNRYRKVWQKKISMIERFTASNYKEYCDRLAATDKKIQKIIKTFGYPLFLPRSAKFDGLVQIILEQQVSLASALAIYKKLKFPIGDLALVKSMVENQLIDKSPSKEEIQRVAEQHKPLRSIFAMILWHAYIVKRNMILPQ